MEIEIFSDVVCPWCYIGKKRLDAAMDTPVGEGVTLRWRPYQLYPNMPPDGMDRARYLEARYGADADPGRVPERIEAEAGEVGVKLDFSAIEKMPNTFQAHRLLELAAARGVQHELAEVLFDYYFCSGRDVGDLDVLVEAAETLGLERDRVRDYLAGTEGVDAVREQLERAVDVGFRAFPVTCSPAVLPCRVLRRRKSWPSS